MSEEDTTAFDDVVGEGEGDEEVVQGEVPAAAPSPAGVAAAVAQPAEQEWVEEILGRLAAGESLNAGDQRRAVYAQQLQAQQFSAQQQARAEAAAQRVAREAALGQKEVLQQLAAVKQASAAEVAALRAELDEVKKGKEEDTEPAFREFVSRSKKNPFGGPGAAREDAAAEPALRFYTDEVAFKFIESKGGKDFHNFQALESAAEALFDVTEKLQELFPCVVEKVNPDKSVDLESAEHLIEIELCKVFNTLKATYDNIINPQLSYLQLEAVLRKRHGNSTEAVWISALLTALQRQLHGVVGTPLPDNLAPRYATVISDLEQRFSSQIAKQAAYTATRSSAGLPNRSPYQAKAGGSFGSTVGSRAAARDALGGSAGSLSRRE
jgi:hypothetical protein